MCFGGGGGDDYAKKAYQDEQARQARIRQGTARINSTFDGQFTPEYFNRLRQNFLDYALPQVQKQYGDASDQLKFAMSRGGLTDSSVNAQKRGKLDELNALRAREVADQAQGYSTNARNSVEDARSGLISVLSATGDADQAARSAINRASALSQPPAYSPVSQLFGDFTAGLGQQMALERAQAFAGPGTKIARYNTGLFGGGNSVVVA
jgi:hypothetical protein